MAIITVIDRQTNQFPSTCIITCLIVNCIYTAFFTVSPAKAEITLEELNKRLERVEKENSQLRAMLRKRGAQEPLYANHRHNNSKGQASSNATRTNVNAPYQPQVTKIDADQWQGIYAGINAGYGRGVTTNGSNIYALNAWPYYPSSPVNSQTYLNQQYTTDISGPVVGGQIGYNHLLSNRLMVGIEADLDYSDVNTGHSDGNNLLVSTLCCGYMPQYSVNSNIHAERKGLDWLGTIRARLGYAFGRFLPYITAGLAYGGISEEISRTYNVETSSSRNSAINIGWAAGAGAELMVADSWSVKGEYLFTSIGGLSTTTIGSSSPLFNYSTNRSIVAETSSIGRFGVHQVRVGLNYHTDWFGSP